MSAEQQTVEQNTTAAIDAAYKRAAGLAAQALDLATLGAAARLYTGIDTSFPGHTAEAREQARTNLAARLVELSPTDDLTTDLDADIANHLAVLTALR